MELVCPAGSPPALRAAVDNGADAVYIGFKDDTNARHFAGLNFDDAKAQQALAYARDHGVKLFVAINTYAQSQGWERWRSAVDKVAGLQADALIAADIGIMDYAARQYPQLNLHLSVQGSATNYEALRFYHSRFNIKRAVLPRVLSLPQVRQVASHSPVDLEVFAFGSLCIMAEGRCYMSSYMTGESPNNSGACSPAKFVKWEQKDGRLESRLNGSLIDRFEADENAGYPTLCKGRFDAGDSHAFHVFEEPTSLNTLDLIPELAATGVKAVKIEGRQRSPSYVAQVVSTWRQALDCFQREPAAFRCQQDWLEALQALSEGAQTTLGAYSRPWQ
ncbi:peptidase U32 family protein [Hahella aquimaris]|uniref:ubiquinone anaerobic biosynthesis protein UbiU n=1 Tax=Hahella sp. HNIBRBA332 TaxID=3015983 RepID=UPI00273C3AE3|nr:peptidase U32 family protein [Hahella sp. HNIBRBA332]WLQ11240.1 peptidase U32 family protein [Hahella sp. HNIBRBA332]